MAAGRRPPGGKRGAINERRHRSQVMPKGASQDQRVRWHLAHAEA